VERPHWLLTQEPPRRRIDAATVVEQAHALVHEGGSDALTMRPLAAALGTSTSALYRLVPSRQWLLVAIVDLIFSEVEVPAAGGAPGARRRLERLSASMHDVLVAHPHLHEVLTSHVAVTPSTVAIAEAALGCLRGIGTADAELVDAFTAWNGYVIGYTAIEAKPIENEPDPALRRAMRRELDAAARSDAPLVAASMPALAERAFGLGPRSRQSRPTTSSFSWGLAALLDGIEVRARSSRS
jgi:AcrR family transcriptional regulator